MALIDSIEQCFFYLCQPASFPQSLWSTCRTNNCTVRCVKFVPMCSLFYSLYTSSSKVEIRLDSFTNCTVKLQKFYGEFSLLWNTNKVEYCLPLRHFVLLLEKYQQSMFLCIQNNFHTFRTMSLLTVWQRRIHTAFVIMTFV